MRIGITLRALALNFILLSASFVSTPTIAVAQQGVVGVPPFSGCATWRSTNILTGSGSACGVASSIAIGTPITGGTDKCVFFDDAATLGCNSGLTFNKATNLLTVGGPVTAANLEAVGVAPLTRTFIGSGAPAGIWVNAAITAQSASRPEIAAQFAINSNLGSGDPAAYKIALTYAAVGGLSSAPLYGGNGIVSGYAGAGGYLLTGNEIDVNNLGANADSLGVATASYGHMTAAAGNFRSTAAYAATGITASWQYGFAIFDYPGAGVAGANAAGFYEGSTSQTAFRIENVHTTGIDMSAATISFALVVANNVSAVYQFDNVGAGKTLLKLDNTGTTQWGYSSSYNSLNGAAFFPTGNNTTSLGFAGHLWSDVLTVNLHAGAASTSTGQIALANASSAFLTTLQAGNAAAARVWTLPTNFGSAGCVWTDAAADGALSCVSGALPSLSGTTGSIGGGALLAGACTSGTVAVTNSTTSMVVGVSANTYPGDGSEFFGYVSANGTVTVKVCALVALTPNASTYNVRVIQ